MVPNFVLEVYNRFKCIEGKKKSLSFSHNLLCISQNFSMIFKLIRRFSLSKSLLSVSLLWLVRWLSLLSLVLYHYSK